MRFHCVSLPHTQTTSAFIHCAYTTKVVRFCDMMTSLGHEVFLYSSEENDACCKEHISVISKTFQDRFFHHDHTKNFFPIEWDINLPYWQLMNTNAIDEIGKRIESEDFICLIGGLCQKPIADAFPENPSVEYGIGYDGIFAPFCAFESYAWMHYVYGLRGIMDGRYFDAVIPNYYPVEDFPLCEQKDDYLLQIGRVTKRKGLDVANEICKRTGRKLVIVGQGASVSDNHLLGDHVTLDCDFEYLGVVTDPIEKARLIGRASAVLVNTQYIGPFEGVHVEAMLCGTPVITTDWGVFTETVEHGACGFRTRTLGESIWAVNNLDKLNSPSDIRKYAISKFDMNVVKYQFEDWFNQISMLRGDGWYELESVTRSNIDRYQ